VLLRPFEPGDVPALEAIVNEPEIARWWGPHDAERVRTELTGETQGFVIVVDGAVAGWLQCEEETDADYRHASLDIFLTTDLHGRGYGREALSLAIDHLIARGHHRFTIDPAVDNRRAIHVYSTLGFRPVGVMREYERGPDGRWHDGLLMELLAAERRTRARTSGRSRPASPRPSPRRSG
jgi:aminoglycoside 6'-N-acetyltransferase